MLEDLRFAWRRLRSAPGSTLVAVLTLALTVGANTAIFSVADAVLFRPFPYADPDGVRIVQMEDRRTGARYTLVPYEYVRLLEEHHQGLGPVGILERRGSLVVDSGGGVDSVSVAAVTAGYFRVLGVQAARGRLFDESDGAEPGRSAVITHAAWRQRFGGDTDVVGSSVTLGDATFDVVGVLPAGFVFPSGRVGDPEIVTVMAALAAGTAGGTFHPVVRLEPGVTVERAQAEIDALVVATVGSSAEEDAMPVLSDVRSVLYPAGRPIMALLLVAAGLVLLIGCANLATVLVARVQRQERELAVRAALGASRVRLLRPLVLESLLVGVGGAVLAIVTTHLAFDALLAQVPPVAYGNAPVGVDLRVGAFALALGLLGGLAFSVVPAWWADRSDPRPSLQGRRRGARPGWLARPLRPLIVAQVALSVVVLFGAAVAGEAFLSVLSVPLGFAPESVVTVEVSPARDDGLSRQDFYARAARELAARGDVVAAGAAGPLPLSGALPMQAARPDGSEEAVAGIQHALPGYWEAAGVRFLQGRLPGWSDVREGADVAVVTEAAARALFGEGEPLGATFRDGAGRRLVVIGVVEDVRMSLTAEYPPPVWVIPGEDTRRMSLVARTRARDDRTLAGLERQVGRLAPGRPVVAGWWSDSIADRTVYRNPRFQTLVLGAFGTLAVTLTALGIFAVVAFLVAARTRELGIRLALGSTSGSLVALVVRQSAVPVGVGLLIGLVATRWLSPLAEAQLFEVTTDDPVTLAAVVMAVAAAGLVAAYLPARRASRIEPLEALTAE